MMLPSSRPFKTVEFRSCSNLHECGHKVRFTDNIHRLFACTTSISHRDVWSREKFHTNRDWILHCFVNSPAKGLFNYVEYSWWKSRMWFLHDMYIQHNYYLQLLFSWEYSKFLPADNVFHHAGIAFYSLVDLRMINIT